MKGVTTEFVLKINHLKKYVTAIFLASVVSFGASTGLAAYEGKQLIPMGNAVGINIRSDGVMIVGMPELLSDGQSPSPARTAGLSPGDIITKIGSHRISSTEDLKTAISSWTARPCPFKSCAGAAN